MVKETKCIFVLIIVFSDHLNTPRVNVGRTCKWALVALGILKLFDWTTERTDLMQVTRTINVTRIFAAAKRQNSSFTSRRSGHCFLNSKEDAVFHDVIKPDEYANMTSNFVPGLSLVILVINGKLSDLCCCLKHAYLEQGNCNLHATNRKFYGTAKIWNAKNALLYFHPSTPL